jgi:hypothetical protein
VSPRCRSRSSMLVTHHRLRETPPAPGLTARLGPGAAPAAGPPPAGGRERMRTTTKLLPSRCNCAFALERRPVLLTRPCRRVPTKGGGPDAGADSTPHAQTDPLPLCPGANEARDKGHHRSQGTHHESTGHGSFNGTIVRIRRQPTDQKVAHERRHKVAADSEEQADAESSHRYEFSLRGPSAERAACVKASRVPTSAWDTPILE